MLLNIHRMALVTQNYLVQNVSRDAVEKAWAKRIWTIPSFHRTTHCPL